MNFFLKATGFINETISVQVTVNSSKADEVIIGCYTDGVYNSDDKDSDMYPLPASFAASRNWSSDGVWSCNYNGSWEKDPTKIEFHCFCPAVEVETKLKELMEAFYSFHKAQNEIANFTIQTIKSLRIEDIVGEQSWEVVKTTSRRGTARR